MTWIRETDTKLHAVDLKATSQEKKDQLEMLKVILTLYCKVMRNSKMLFAGVFVNCIY